MNSFLDLFGNKLEVGDYFAIARGDYGRLYLGKIVGFTAKMVKIEWHTKESAIAAKISNIRMDSRKFIKVSEEDVTMFTLRN